MKRLLLLALVAGCATTHPAARRRVQTTPSSLDLSRVEERLQTPTDDADAAGLARARELLGPLAERGHELDDWARTLLDSYVPHGRALPKKVYVDVGLRRPVEVVPDPVARASSVVLVDLGSPVWKGSVDVLWTELLRALYAATLPPPPPVLAAPPRDERALIEHVQARLFAAGVPTYVASLGGRSAERSPPPDRDAVSAAFARVSDAVMPPLGSRHRSPAQRWHQLLAEDAASPVFAVAGAAMASALDQERGREGLVQAVVEGPAAFDAAYRALQPGALLSYELPPSAVVAH